MFAKLLHVELLLLLVLLVEYSNHNALDDVGTLINGFSEMTDSGIDVLDKLEKISKGSFSLAKLAGPLGQLVHTSITVTLKEDSDELLAIKRLHDKVTAKFDELSHKMDDMVAHMQYGQLMEFYQEKVTANIAVFEHQISKFLASRSMKSKDHLEDMCKDLTNSPIKLLIWIHGKVNRKVCTLPNMIESRVYARALALLGKMDERLVEEQSREFIETVEYKEWKASMLYKLTELPYLDAIRYLANIERGLSNGRNTSLVQTIADLSQRLVQAFGSITHKNSHAHHKRVKRDKAFSCMLKSITMAYGRRREPLLDISKMVITDVTKIEFIGIMCASIMAGGNTMDYQKDLEKYEGLAKEIALSMNAWIRAELSAIWPDVTISHISNALGTKDIKEADYGRMALLVQKEANARGNASYLHQVIIGPNWERDRYFHEECEPGECATISGKLGVKVVITRYNNYDKDLFDRLLASLEWIEQNRSAVIEQFKKQLDVLGGNAKLADFIQQVSAALNFNFMVGHNHWRHMVILHNRKWFPQDCVIPVGFAGSTVFGTKAYDNATDVFVTSSFSVANRYKLYLMI